MKQIVFNEKAIEIFNGEKAKALDDIAVTIVHKDTLKQKDREIERLHSIIKEAIEYIELWHYRNDFRVNSFTKGVKEDLLEILKGSDK